MEFPSVLIEPTADILSNFLNKALFHPHYQSHGEAARVSSSQKHLLTHLSFTAYHPTRLLTPSSLLLMNFSRSVLERLIQWACGASKAFISFSTSVIFTEQMKWTSGQQSSWSTDGIWQVSSLYNDGFTLKEKNGRRTQISQASMSVCVCAREDVCRRVVEAEACK